MPVKKVQVTFDVTDVERVTPLGTPIICASAVLQRGCHQLVYYRGMWGALAEVYRAQIPRVPLTADSMELLAARMEGEFRAALIPAFGAQMNLDLVDP